MTFKGAKGSIRVQNSVEAKINITNSDFDLWMECISPNLTQMCGWNHQKFSTLTLMCGCNVYWQLVGLATLLKGAG